MWHETAASVRICVCRHSDGLWLAACFNDWILSITKLTFLSKCGVWSENRGNRDTESCRIKYALTYILSLQKQSRVESRRLRQVDTCVGLDLRRRSENTEIATASLFSVCTSKEKHPGPSERQHSCQVLNIWPEITRKHFPETATRQNPVSFPTEFRKLSGIRTSSPVGVNSGESTWR